MNITMFFDLSSFIITFGSILITALLSKSYKILIMGINSFLSKKYHIFDDDKIKVILLFRLISRINIGIGCIVVIIDFILIISTDVDVTVIFMNMRTGILPLLYAAIINTLFFYPAIYKFEKQIIRRRMNEKEDFRTKI